MQGVTGFGILPFEGANDSVRELRMKIGKAGSLCGKGR
jgi:hypothetical protein